MSDGPRRDGAGGFTSGERWAFVLGGLAAVTYGAAVDVSPGESALLVAVGAAGAFVLDVRARRRQRAEARAARRACARSTVTKMGVCR